MTQTTLKMTTQLTGLTLICLAVKPNRSAAAVKEDCQLRIFHPTVAESFWV